MDTLFLGASQVFGWQGSYSLPNYPFGLYVGQFEPWIKPVISGVPGDCLGGAGGPANYPPGQTGPTGFVDRLQSQLQNKTYDLVVILGGANDINQACFSNNPRFFNNETQAIQNLAALVGPNTRLVLMPTYSAPLYQTKCTDLYKSFVSTMLAEQLRLPSNVRVIDSARFTATLNASFYVDDLHLNQKGAYLFAQGLSKWLELDYGKTTETNWATFQVTHDAGFGDSVAVVGSFQGWNTCQAIPCKYLSNNVWSCDAVPVTPGFRYEWKAIAYGTKSGRSCTSPLWQPGPNAFFTGLSGWTPQFTSY